jgi:hypothetical protein
MALPTRIRNSELTNNDVMIDWQREIVFRKQTTDRYGPLCTAAYRYVHVLRDSAMHGVYNRYNYQHYFLCCLCGTERGSGGVERFEAFRSVCD